MRIEIYGTEAPAVLRAVSTMLRELANANLPNDHGGAGRKGLETALYAPYAASVASPTTVHEAAPDDAPAEAAPDDAPAEAAPQAVQGAFMFNQDELDEAELDSEGQEWNAELHSSSKKKVADGTWRKRRNLDMPVPPPPPPPPTASEPTFADFMALTQTLMAEKKLSPPEVMAAAIECGLPSMAALALPENARLIPAMIRLVTK